MSTSVWTNVCEEQTASKHFTSRVSWHCCSESGKFLAPKNCKTRIFHSRSSTFKFSMRQHQIFIKPPRQRRLWRSESRRFRPALNFTQYWSMNALPETHNGSRCPGKKQVSLDLEITRSFSVSPYAAPVDGGQDFVRGSALNDELLAGQQQLTSQYSKETGVRSNDDRILDYWTNSNIRRT